MVFDAYSSKAVVLMLMDSLLFLLFFFCLVIAFLLKGFSVQFLLT